MAGVGGFRDHLELLEVSSFNEKNMQIVYIKMMFRLKLEVLKPFFAGLSPCNIGTSRLGGPLCGCLTLDGL